MDDSARKGNEEVKGKMQVGEIGRRNMEAAVLP